MDGGVGEWKNGWMDEWVDGSEETKRGGEGKKKLSSNAGREKW